MKRAQRIASCAGCAALLLMAMAPRIYAEPARIPAPGTVNYIEGQVALNGQTLHEGSLDSAPVARNQTLETAQGRAELLLTPGVFLRLDNNSEVQMLSPGLADTSVSVMKGSAMLEAAELYKENRLSVLIPGAKVQIDKMGLYEVSADQPAVSVLAGEATVYEGDAHVNLKKGHEVVIAAGQPLKSQGFDERSVENRALYRWSKLRSQYEAAANLDAARTVVVNGGWYGPGWYWDSYWSFYAFLPADGFLYSPFGWGFYSPWQIYGYPGVGHRTGWYGRAPLGRGFATGWGGFGHFGGFHGGFRGGRG